MTPQNQVDLSVAKFGVGWGRIGHATAATEGLLQNPHAAAAGAAFGRLERP